MIHSIAELFEELRAKESLALRAFGDIGHQGMIGDMYEGLTRDLVQRSLFDDIDLRVVTGKVRLPNGGFSRQMDVMIVVGDGDQIPYTEHYLYPLERVIAVIEVKKTLYGEALADAYLNLESVRDREALNATPRKAFASAFRMLAQIGLPASGDLDELPINLEMMAFNLAYDAALPVRIVFGYDGYQTESTLRNGLVTHIENVMNDGFARGYGPSNFPSLIVCGSNALVKLNAMPYAAHTASPDSWMLYGSVRGLAARTLLEVIWTRLLARGAVHSDVFGEDLDTELVRPLLSAQFVQVDAAQGWRYEFIKFTETELATASTTISWEPIFLSKDEAVLVMYLCEVQELHTVSNEFWTKYAMNMGEGLDTSLEYLRRQGLAKLGHDGVLRLLTNTCRVLCTPTHGWVAGEDESGRLMRWIMKHTGVEHPDSCSAK